jgi:hypothetical protein
MLPERLLKDRFWLQLALIVLVVIWSMPVVALALYADSQVVSALLFALAWSGLMAALGLLVYGLSKNNSQVGSVVILLALATLVLLYRTPSSFVEPQFKSEDGIIFYAQQRELGLATLVTPYNGYYHTIIRILVELIAPMPTLFAPAFYALAWLGVYSLVVAYCWAQYPNKKWAPFVALVPAFVSHTGEVFMSMTYTIWIAGLFLTAFVLMTVPQFKSWNRYLLTGLLLIFSLSGPFSVALAPFYFLRWVVDRKNFPGTYVATVLLGAVIQLSTIHARNAGENSGAHFAFSDLILGLKIAVLRVPWSLAVGHQPVDPYWLIGLVLTLVLLGYMTWEIMTNFRKNHFAVGCLAFCGIFGVLNFMRVEPPELLTHLINGDRYFYVPKILFVWALIQLATTAVNPKPFYVALFFCVMGSIGEFNSQEVLLDHDWPRYAVLIDQGQPVAVPTNPPGSQILVNGAKAVPVEK